MDTGIKINNMAKEEELLKMEIFIKEILNMVLLVGMEYILTSKIIIDMKGIGKMIYHMGMESRKKQTEKYTKENLKKD